MPTVTDHSIRNRLTLALAGAMRTRFNDFQQT